MALSLAQLLERFTISPKNLRVCTIVIAIYQVLLSSFILFIVLLGLSHAEEMDSLLHLDMEAQEAEDYIMSQDLHSMPMNEYRFKTAAELASNILIAMYTASAIFGIYALSCFCLLFGVLRMRSELLLPWLIVTMIGLLLTVDLMVLHTQSIVVAVGGKTNYWILCGAIISFDVLIWVIVHTYYRTLCHMKKLNECAVIPIPCPATPYYHHQLTSNEKEAMLVGLTA